MKLMELGEICESMHQGINTAADKVDYSIDGYQILQSRNITQGFIDYTDSKRVDFETYQKYKEKYNPRPGDILLCNIGTIGNSLVVKQENDFLIAWNLFLLKVNQSLVHPNYLNYFLIYLRETNFYTKFLTGGTVKFISKTTLSSIKIPLPPLEEQKRIAAILDKADRIRRKRQEAIRLTEELGRSIFLDMFGDPVTNPKGWEIDDLGNVGILDRGKSKHRPRNDLSLLGGKYPLIQTGDVANSQGFIQSYSQTYSEKGLAQSRLWKAGTLCITIAANIADTGILEFDACFPDSIVGFTPSISVTTEYVKAWFQFFQPILEANAPQSAQKNINLAILRKLEIIVPPIEKQKYFSKLINKLRVDSEKQKQYSKEAENLFNSLLQRAFRGEL